MTDQPNLLPVLAEVRGGAVPVAHPSPMARAMRVLRRRLKWAIPLALVLGVAGGYLGYKQGTPIYRSNGTIRIEPTLPRILFQNEQNNLMPMFEAFIDGQVALIRSQRVVEMAMQN